jgi:hypothetical protein
MTNADPAAILAALALPGLTTGFGIAEHWHAVSR